MPAEERIVESLWRGLRTGGESREYPRRRRRRRAVGCGDGKRVMAVPMKNTLQEGVPNRVCGLGFPRMDWPSFRDSVLVALVRVVAVGVVVVLYEVLFTLGHAEQVYRSRLSIPFFCSFAGGDYRWCVCLYIQTSMPSIRVRTTETWSLHGEFC